MPLQEPTLQQGMMVHLGWKLTQRGLRRQGPWAGMHVWWRSGVTGTSLTSASISQPTTWEMASAGSVVVDAIRCHMPTSTNFHIQNYSMSLGLPSKFIVLGFMRAEVPSCAESDHCQRQHLKGKWQSRPLTHRGMICGR